MAVESPDGAPSPQALQPVFRVYEVHREDGALHYVGDPVSTREQLVETAWPLFREHGYQVSLAREGPYFELVAEPSRVGVDGVPWTNLVLLALTAVTTLWAGTLWYYTDPAGGLGAVLEGLPFVLAVLGVLGTHELGHYAMSRYHHVNATLPYFIPMVPPFGTMGAVIRMKGQIPSRRALFDIGVAGPIAGLVATVVVTAVGLTLPPVTVPEWVLNSPDSVAIEFGYPPLMQAVAWAVGEPLSYADPRTAVNPVVLGGWLGMLITFLNLLPVGQLDGGHVTRAVLGPVQARLGLLVPLALFGLAGGLSYLGGGSAVGIWVLWGVLATVMAYVGPAKPVSEATLGWPRTVVGALTMAAGVLCFTPLPIQIVG